MSIEMEITKPQKIRAKELRMHLKVRDEFTASLHAEDGSEIFGQEDGYVPGFMPEQHYGDYVILNIDLESGKITNWKKPTAQQLHEWINSDKQD